MADLIRKHVTYLMIISLAFFSLFGIYVYKVLCQRTQAQSIVVSKRLVDHGFLNIRSTTVLKNKFVLENKSWTDVSIEKISANCACANAKITGNTIKRGGSEILEISFVASPSSGLKSVIAIIEFGDKSTLDFEIQGYVRSSIKILPSLTEFYVQKGKQSAFEFRVVKETFSSDPPVLTFGPNNIPITLSVERSRKIGEKTTKESTINTWEYNVKGLIVADSRLESNIEMLFSDGDQVKSHFLFYPIML